MKLFEPGTIGTLEIKNRIVMAPMGLGRMDMPDGSWGERVCEYYAARARGGTGLITTSLVFVTRDLEPFSRDHHLNLYSDHHLASLQNVAKAVHRYGAKLSVQLTAGFGRVLTARRQSPDIPPVSASDTPCFFNPERKARALTMEEVHNLAESFGIAAKRCRMAEVDAVELHGHEGYLLDQFMSGIWNKRNDRYGGSRERRLTLVREAVSAMQREAGDDFPLIYRFGIDHYLDGGRSVEESLWIAKQLEVMDFHALHVDAGCYETTWWPHPPTYQPAGCMVDMARKVKPEVNIPIIAVGKLHYPDLAERVLQEGNADFIAIGRGLLADADWPIKVMEGRVEDIAPCIGDHDGCSAQMQKGGATSCTVNPFCSHENSWDLAPVNKKKTLLVVGGGPAGMEAARVAAIRGLKVMLWEKEDRLGGNLIPASVPDFKKDFRELLRYQTTQLKRYAVKIELSKEVCEDDIIRMGPDMVILATGAFPDVPDIQGNGDIKVLSAVQVLSGSKGAGQQVLVVGGELIACETAVHLAQKGCQVTVISAKDEILTHMFYRNRNMLRKMMTDNRVEVLTNAKPVDLEPEGIRILQGDRYLTLPAKTLVYAEEMRPRGELHKALEGKVPKLYAVGDCIKPKRIIDAIWGAFNTARNIKA